MNIKGHNTMNFVWYDYNPGAMNFIENWLDESAVESTGLDDGFRAFYEYWANEDGFAVGENYWCKVTFENGKPFGVVALCEHKRKIIIMEVLISPDERGQGKGTAIIKELLNNEQIIGFTIQKSEAVIYPSNIASQKAFEKAGFRYSDSHNDENGDSMYYIYENKSLSTI